MQIIIKVAPRKAQRRHSENNNKSVQPTGRRTKIPIIILPQLGWASSQGDGRESYAGGRCHAQADVPVGRATAVRTDQGGSGKQAATVSEDDGRNYEIPKKCSIIVKKVLDEEKTGVSDVLK